MTQFKNANKKVAQHEVTFNEWTGVWFNYPYLCLIKGNLEIMFYSFTTAKFYYEVLNMPIISISNDVSYNQNSFFVMFDAGSFFLPAEIEVPGGKYFSYYIRYYKRRLLKSNFLDQPMLSFYA